VTLISGASGQGASVVAAPPVLWRDSHTSVRAPARQVAGRDQAVVAAADDDRVPAVGHTAPGMVVFD
jgi:hypothetical protein